MGKQKVAALFVAGVLLFASGYAWHARSNPDTTTSQTNASKDFPLLAKRLFVDNPNDTIINFTTLRKQLNEYMDANGLSGSLYFEYLPTGTSVRIDGDNQEVGASLLKVPAAMDLYKTAEIGKVNLDKTVTLRQEWLNSDYGTLHTKGAGYQLTLREAAKIMLRDSDNTALNAIAYMTTGLLTQDDWVFSATDVDITQQSDLKVSISARSYGSILKCLYYACYIDKKDSQEILGYLTQTPFSNRLVAGIADPSITVAHKIGVANTTDQSDCGIVYLPYRNYLLCIMLNGPDTAEINTHIATLSRITYEYVKN